MNYRRWNAHDNVQQRISCSIKHEASRRSHRTPVSGTERENRPITVLSHTPTIVFIHAMKYKLCHKRTMVDVHCPLKQFKLLSNGNTDQQNQTHHLPLSLGTKLRWNEPPPAPGMRAGQGQALPIVRLPQYSTYTIIISCFLRISTANIRKFSFALIVLAGGGLPPN